MKSYSHSSRRLAPVKSVQKADPKETAQESIHQVMTKTDAKTVKSTAAARQEVKPPMRAAKGDDDLMSMPQRKS